MLPDVQDAEITFARRTRELREARGLSQARLAAEVASAHGLTLDPTAITKLERGQRGVSLAEAVAIASVLGSTVDAMCATGPAQTARDLRRELAAAEAQLVDAEVARYAADSAYAEVRARIEDLQARLQEATAQGGEPGGPR